MHSSVQFVTELREIGFENALKVSFDTPSSFGGDAKVGTFFAKTGHFVRNLEVSRTPPKMGFL